jgi:glycine/D-amino acid oxidase-like deaminating enzyme/nitrite reductase/ring-hydroxylating ferredoxin subunit
MTQLSEKPVSFWIDSTPETDFPDLIDNQLVDVAIVGAGIAGLTAATLLKRTGLSVAVIESKGVAKGVSGHTTAKLTSLHQLIYAELIDKFGEEKARLYGESNEAAIAQVAALVEEEQIDCDFSRQSNYTYADTTDQLSKIVAEVEAAKKLGLPASLVQETSLPFAIAGAVKFENQAQFHVRKYLLHLAKSIPDDNSYLFENTKVETVEENNPCQVVTDKGILRAQKVLITTHLPILDRGLYFAKTYPKRSYIIGARIESAQAPQGMFIGSGNDYNSIRTTPCQDGLLLLIGGGGHKVGTVTDTEERYQKLEQFAFSKFGIDKIDYRWSTQDMVSFDKLPYIGKLTPFDENIYVATGFSLWGMSNGTLSGMLLRDLVLGNSNPWTEFYDSTRATPFLTPQSIKENINVGTHWVGDRLKGLTDSIADVKSNEGKVITVKGEKIAAYRDETGNLHAVSAVCSHLACIVGWNNAEKSWDCPCHGARFNFDGEVIHGPAIENLSRKVDL